MKIDMPRVMAGYHASLITGELSSLDQFHIRYEYASEREYLSLLSCIYPFYRIKDNFLANGDKQMCNSRRHKTASRGGGLSLRVSVSEMERRAPKRDERVGATRVTRKVTRPKWSRNGSILPRDFSPSRWSRLDRHPKIIPCEKRASERNDRDAKERQVLRSSRLSSRAHEKHVKAFRVTPKCKGTPRNERDR